jgi:hypothetical protein
MYFKQQTHKAKDQYELGLDWVELKFNFFSGLVDYEIG